MSTNTAVLYTGCYDFVYAPLTETLSPEGALTATYGEVQRLSYINQFDDSANESAQSYYFDNKPMVNIVGVGNREVNVQVSVLDLKTRAELEGYDYDTTKDALVIGTKRPQYFAVGIKLNRSDNKDEYRWYYKGTFAYQGQSIQTKSDGTEATMDNYIFTAVATTATYAFNSKNEGISMCAIYDDNEGAATYFDEVTTPDKIGVEA